MTEQTGNLIEQIKDIATTIIKKDISTVRGLSERQVEAIARQTQFIKLGYATGEIDNELLTHFLEGLDAMVQNFINTLKGILLVTLEKLWNAIIQVLYKAIGLSFE